MGNPEFRRAVNVSARQLCGADYVERVRSTLHDTELPAAALALALTESVLASTGLGSGQVEWFLTALREALEEEGAADA